MTANKCFLSYPVYTHILSNQGKLCTNAVNANFCNNYNAKCYCASVTALICPTMVHFGRSAVLELGLDLKTLIRIQMKI